MSYLSFNLQQRQYKQIGKFHCIILPNNKQWQCPSAILSMPLTIASCTPVICAANFHYPQEPKIELVPNQLFWLQSLPINLPERPSLAHQRLAGISQKKDETSQKHPGVSQRHAWVSRWLVLDSQRVAATLSRLAVASQKLAVPSQGIDRQMDRIFPFQSAGPFWSLCARFSKSITVCPQNCPFGPLAHVYCCKLVKTKQK